MLTVRPLNSRGFRLSHAPPGATSGARLGCASAASAPASGFPEAAVGGVAAAAFGVAGVAAALGFAGGVGVVVLMIGAASVVIEAGSAGRSTAQVAVTSAKK